MVKSKWGLTAAFTVILATTVHADCTAPTAPPTTFPDGSTASLDTMLAAKKQVDTYLKSAQVYINCVDVAEANEMEKVQANKDMDKDAKAAEIKILGERRKARNDVVDQMKTTGNAFNTEIHKYQAKNK